MVTLLLKSGITYFLRPSRVSASEGARYGGNGGGGGSRVERRQYLVKRKIQGIVAKAIKSNVLT